MTMEIKNLYVSYYNKNIINNFNYIFNNGIYLIISPNGSGKTSIFRSIMELIPSKNNGIIIDNKPIKKMKQKIFYYESSNWFDINLSGWDYLKFVKSQWNSNISIKEIISFWDMKKYIKKPIKKYSLGMKQKLLISLYFISDAKYLIMDEISNGLDEDSRKKLFKKLTEISKNKCIITSSHHKEDLSKHAKTILTIKNNKVVNYYD